MAQAGLNFPAPCPLGFECLQGWRCHSGQPVPVLHPSHSEFPSCDSMEFSMFQFVSPVTGHHCGESGSLLSEPSTGISRRFWYPLPLPFLSTGSPISASPYGSILLHPRFSPCQTPSRALAARAGARLPGERDLGWPGPLPSPGEAAAPAEPRCGSARRH